MRTMKLSHVAIAVKNLEESTKIFSRLFQAQSTGTSVVTDQSVKVAFLHIDDVSIELTESTSPMSPVAKFIEKHGEGIHHLSFEVADIAGELKRLQEEGFRLVDEKPRLGAGGYL